MIFIGHSGEVTNGPSDAPATEQTTCRKVIPATCTVHNTARGFTNLVVRKVDGEIELDPHADQCCLLLLDETAAAALRDQLAQWLG